MRQRHRKHELVLPLEMLCVRVNKECTGALVSNGWRLSGTFILDINCLDAGRVNDLS